VKRKQKTILILILGGLSTVSPFAIDMYLPAFPTIADDLHTSITNVQLSLTSYFIGVAVGQLLYGPMLDRFGRKPPLYVGLIVYILASIGCAVTDTVEGLIAMRFLQALGGCSGMVAAQALVRDLFPAKETAQAFSWMILVVAVSPMIAPTVGGYVTTSLGWPSVFLVLAIVTTIILVAAYFILPHGRQADKTMSLKPKQVLTNFYTVIRQPQFLTYCIAGGLAGAAPFAFIAGSPDVFINQYGKSEEQYGWIFALVGAVIMGGAQFNHLLLKRFTNEQVVFAAILFQVVSGVLFFLAVWLSDLGLPALIALSILFLSVHGLSNANSSALALAPFSKLTGSAASMLGTFRMTIGAFVSGLVSVLHDGTVLPMVGVMVFSAVAGFILLTAGRTVVKYHVRKNQTQPTTVTI
jgi:MFS transporter, DHA1 family, multidrug resistance protein